MKLFGTGAKILFQILENVFEANKIFRIGVHQSFVRFDHTLCLISPPDCLIGCQRCCIDDVVGRFRSFRFNLEKVVESQVAQQIIVALVRISNNQRTIAMFSKTQSDPCQRTHERGVHHGTALEIHREMAKASLEHLLGKFLERRAVLKRTFAIHLDMDPSAYYPNQDGS
jgi:hypothetical protein